MLPPTLRHPGPHPDPTGRHELRWWDGQGWTDQVGDGGVWSTDPLDRSFFPSESAPPVRTWTRFRSLPRMARWAAGGATAVLILGVASAAGGGDGDRAEQVEITGEGDPETTSSTAAPSSTAADTTAPPTTAAPTSAAPATTTAAPTSTTAAPPPTTTAPPPPPATTTVPPPPVATAPSGCDPGYEGACVPFFPPDVNCADVGRPVTIRGSDPHGLDGNDDDGRGCESS